MKNLVDYIKYHGYITSIRDKVDKDYIWFDICQKEFYRDKNGHRQNYIHILKINDLEINKEPPLYGDGYWNGQKIESEEASPEEQAYMQRLIDEITGGE